MILIAESREENAMLDGVTALLCDLGIPIAAYRRQEAFALTLWSASELGQLYTDRFNLTQEQAVALLEEIEPCLQAATATAGVQFLDRALARRGHWLHCHLSPADGEDTDSI